MSETKLRITRLLKGFTQEEIAKAAQISTRRYRDYESGKRIPNALTAIRIANKLNSDVKTLFTPQG